MGNNERKIGFIPNPVCQKDADAVVVRTMDLFRRGYINEVCLFRGFLCRQILLEAGFPQDKITVLLCPKRADEIDKLMLYLKTLPKELILLRVIALSYRCPRYSAKLRRAEIAENAMDSERAPLLIVGMVEVYSGRIDWWYPVHFFQECCRVVKDLFDPLSWQSTD